MAAINVNQAMTTLSRPAFLKSAVLIVAGSLLAQIMTSYLQDNVYDIPYTGADALYPLVAAFLSLSVLPNGYGRNIALGSAATSVRIASDQFGLI